jgi:hypothetical protein
MLIKSQKEKPDLKARQRIILKARRVRNRGRSDLRQKAKSRTVPYCQPRRHARVQQCRGAANQAEFTTYHNFK